jgi:hypothetical protein
MVVVVKTSKMD